MPEATQANQLHKLQRLIDLFRDNIDQYKSSYYDESNARTDFIDKFFELLGWDVRNVEGHSEQYRDVVREDKLPIGHWLQFPDYCFRIGKERKFFVEAKKPAVNIHDDIAPAYQIRRYGYTAKLALSILTDFEEFAVYDTRIKPHPNDKASKGRIFYCRYDQYLAPCDFDGFVTNFDFIVGTFAKTAVLRGSFDRYADSTKNRRGTSEVDKDLLALIEDWRLELARSLAKTNSGLGIYDLNVAVQRIIDRILFLRIAEDRRIERYENLLRATAKQGIYKNLYSLFVNADEKYNAGLFKQEDWLNRLHIDDKVLAPIIKGLYPPESPYAFSVLPIEILGSIYERFLGKTIRLTSGHQAKVEEKPEVRKAGGVYYTPQYIVNYIVHETVGLKIDGKKPPAIENLQFLDPACGSGSFLVGVYTYLLDWHLAYYVDEANRKAALKKGKIYQIGDEAFRLTIEEKQRILLNNIYGVDIDPLAAEVTKLSLYLKLLENETVEEGNKLFSTKLLPNLDQNIQCGNSLIASDFYSGRQLDLFDNEAMRKVNAFDWEAAFPHVFKAGGFDCVIGNPPYVRIQQMKESAPEHVDYYNCRYRAAVEGNYDLYTVFIEKELSLLNEDGRLGIICPNKFFTAQYGRPIRHILSEGKHLSQIVNFGHHQVFENATTYTALLFADKSPCKELGYTKVLNLESWKTEQGLTVKPTQEKKRRTLKQTPVPETKIIASETGTIPAKTITDGVWNFSVGKGASLFEKLSGMPVKLGDVAKIFVGTQTSDDDVFVLSKCRMTKKHVYGYSKALDENIKIELAATVSFLKGKDIRAYQQFNITHRLICPYEIDPESSVLMEQKALEAKFPLTFEYLCRNMKRLKNRENGKFKRRKDWYGFGYPKSMSLFQYRKIIVPDYNNVPSFTLNEHGCFFKTGYGIILLPHHSTIDLRFLLTLLNSKLLFAQLNHIGTFLRGGYVRFWTQYIEKLPIVMPETKRHKQIHDRLVSLADQMLAAQEKLRAAISDGDRKLAGQRISILDKQIDPLVYELYGLTDEEIAVVENNK